MTVLGVVLLLAALVLIPLVVAEASSNAPVGPNWVEPEVAAQVDQTSRVVLGGHKIGESTDPTRMEQVFTDTHNDVTEEVVWLGKNASLSSTGTLNEYDITLHVSTIQDLKNIVIPQDAAVVLVMDVSGSMRYGADSTSDDDVKYGDSRLKQMREAAAAFVDNYAETAIEGAQRHLALVQFGKDAIAMSKYNDGGYWTWDEVNNKVWLDLSSGDAKAREAAANTAKARIALAGNALYGNNPSDSTMSPSGATSFYYYTGGYYATNAGTATNVAGGLMLAESLLKKIEDARTVTDPDTLVETKIGMTKYVILLTDGEPNRYPSSTGPSASTTYITGSQSGEGYSAEAAEIVANRLRDADVYANMQLYSIGFCTKDRTFQYHSPICGSSHSWHDNKCYKMNINTWLKDYISDKFYPASAENLNLQFDEIAESIGLLASAWQVSDPMAEYITFKGVVEGTGKDATLFSSTEALAARKVTFVGDTLTWDLASIQPTKREVGDTTYFDYSLTYRVALNPDGLNTNYYYPTNGKTILDYFILHDGEDLPEDAEARENMLKKAEFYVPTVCPQLPEADIYIDKTVDNTGSVAAADGTKFTFTLYHANGDKLGDEAAGDYSIEIAASDDPTAISLNTQQLLKLLGDKEFDYFYIVEEGVDGNGWTYADEQRIIIYRSGKVTKDNDNEDLVTANAPLRFENQYEAYTITIQYHVLDNKGVWQNSTVETLYTGAPGAYAVGDGHFPTSKTVNEVSGNFAYASNSTVTGNVYTVAEADAWKNGTLSKDIKFDAYYVAFDNLNLKLVKHINYKNDEVDIIDATFEFYLSIDDKNYAEVTIDESDFSSNKATAVFSLCDGITVQDLRGKTFDLVEVSQDNADGKWSLSAADNDGKAAKVDISKGKQVIEKYVSISDTYQVSYKYGALYNEFVPEHHGVSVDLTKYFTGSAEDFAKYDHEAAGAVCNFVAHDKHTDECLIICDIEKHTHGINCERVECDGSTGCGLTDHKSCPTIIDKKCPWPAHEHGEGNGEDIANCYSCGRKVGETQEAHNAAAHNSEDPTNNSIDCMMYTFTFELKGDNGFSQVKELKVSAAAILEALKDGTGLGPVEFDIPANGDFDAKAVYTITETKSALGWAVDSKLNVNTTFSVSRLGGEQIEAQMTNAFNTIVSPAFGFLKNVEDRRNNGALATTYEGDFKFLITPNGDTDKQLSVTLSIGASGAASFNTPENKAYFDQFFGQEVSFEIEEVIPAVSDAEITDYDASVYVISFNDSGRLTGLTKDGKAHQGSIVFVNSYHKNLTPDLTITKDAINNDGEFKFKVEVFEGDAVEAVVSYITIDTAVADSYLIDTLPQNFTGKVTVTELNNWLNGAEDHADLAKWNFDTAPKTREYVDGLVKDTASTNGSLSFTNSYHEPNIEIGKTAGGDYDEYDEYYVRAMVTYTLTVKNTSAELLDNIVVKDSYFDQLTDENDLTVTLGNGDAYTDFTFDSATGKLAMKDTFQLAKDEYFTVEYQLSFDLEKNQEGQIVKDEFTNEADVTAKVVKTSVTIGDDAEKTIKVKEYDPEISLTKDSDAQGDPTKTVELKAPVVYTVEIRNDGDDALTAITVEDSKFNDTVAIDHVVAGVPTTLAADAYTLDNGMISFDVAGVAEQFVLQPGEKLVITYTVSYDTTGTHENTATVHAVGVNSRTQDLTASDKEDVLVSDPSKPSIEIDKVANATSVRVGTDIVYTLTVTNTGNQKLGYFEIRDNRLANYAGDFTIDGGNGVSFKSFTTIVDPDDITKRLGFLSLNGTLDPGSSFTVKYTLNAAQVGPFDNTATITAKASENGNPVDDEDSVRVTVSGGGGDNNERPNRPTPPTPEPDDNTIANNETPTGETPDLPDETIIVDDPVVKGNLPQTGARGINATALLAVALLALAGLGLLIAPRALKK